MNIEKNSEGDLLKQTKQVSHHIRRLKSLPFLEFQALIEKKSGHRKTIILLIHSTHAVRYKLLIQLFVEIDLHVITHLHYDLIWNLIYKIILYYFFSLFF